jgi:hypothetical protein
MFTRRPIPDKTAVAGGYAQSEAIKGEFMEMARRGAANLDAEDQEWFVATFKDLYLSEFMECARGIDDAEDVDDLEYFMRRAQDQMKAWPDLVRT